MKKKTAERLMDYREEFGPTSYQKKKKKKNQIGTLGHQVVLFLGLGTLSGTSEKASNFGARVLPHSPCLPYAISSPSQEGAGRETGHWLSFSFSRTWPSLTIGAPRRLALAPRPPLPLPGQQLHSQGSQTLPLLTIEVPAQTHTASSPLDKCPDATGTQTDHLQSGSWCLSVYALFLLILSGSVNSMTLAPWLILTPLSLSPAPIQFLIQCL